MSTVTVFKEVTVFERFLACLPVLSRKFEHTGKINKAFMTRMFLDLTVFDRFKKALYGSFQHEA